MDINQGPTFKYFYIGLISFILGVIMIVNGVNLIILLTGILLSASGILIFLSLKTVKINLKERRVCSVYNFLFYTTKNEWKKIESTTLILLSENKQSKTMNYRSNPTTIQVQSYSAYFYFNTNERLEIKEWKDYNIATKEAQNMAKKLNLNFINKVGKT